MVTGQNSRTLQLFHSNSCLLILNFSSICRNYFHFHQFSHYFQNSLRNIILINSFKDWKRDGIFFLSISFPSVHYHVLSLSNWICSMFVSEFLKLLESLHIFPILNILLHPDVLIKFHCLNCLDQ